jgi:hypothetical protein
LCFASLDELSLPLRKLLAIKHHHRHHAVVLISILSTFAKERVWSALVDTEQKIALRHGEH